MAGVYDEHLKIRLAAAPVEGAASEALQRFLARAFGVPRGHVDIVSGFSSRRKQVVMRGAGVLPAWAPGAG